MNARFLSATTTIFSLHRFFEPNARVIANTFCYVLCRNNRDDKSVFNHFTFVRVFIVVKDSCFELILPRYLLYVLQLFGSILGKCVLDVTGEKNHLDLE